MIHVVIMNNLKEQLLDDTFKLYHRYNNFSFLYVLR